MEITPLSSLAGCEPPLRLSESRLKNHNLTDECDDADVENNEAGTDEVANFKENKKIHISSSDPSTVALLDYQFPSFTTSNNNAGAVASQTPMIENADLAENIEYTNESNDGQKGSQATKRAKKEDLRFSKRHPRKNKLSEAGSGVASAVVGLEPSDAIISGLKSNSHQRSSTGKRRQSPSSQHHLMMTSQFASSSAAAIAGKDTTTNANAGGAPSNTKEEKELARMGQRYMRLMTDNKWMVDLEKMGRNLDSLKFREK